MTDHSGKIFILDTNVILHDYNCLTHFEENHIVIPITVLEELDKFKQGNNMINYHARQFMRELDKLSGDDLFGEGIHVGPDHGILTISTGKKFSEEMLESFTDKSADHRIIAVADHYCKTNPEKKVVLVSKDINMRMKAKSLGIPAQDYEAGKVADVERFDKATAEDSYADDKLINSLYHAKGGIALSEFDFENTPDYNSYFILKGANSSVLTACKKAEEMKKLFQVSKQTAFHITPRNAEQTFSVDALLDKEVLLTALTGKAGTGKTLLALAAALEQNRDYKQIMLARPIVPLSNRDIGYLPGDQKEKIGPYMQPLFDNLNVIKHQFSSNSKEHQRIEAMLEEEKLLITPLAYIRGRSLSKTFFIVDEAQNLTPHEVKTIITRAGEGTKMVFTGDIFQIDSPYLDKKSNGLSYLIDRMSGEDIFSHVNLVKGERSKLSELAGDLL
ncbi:MAG: PhoH family protein [Bacteroidota bacterium]|nr:PhoH family protein [Bacteroidota bacterium]